MCCIVIKSYKGMNPSLSLAWVCRVSGFLIFCVQQKNTSVIITHKQTFHGHSVFSAPVMEVYKLGDKSQSKAEIQNLHNVSTETETETERV